MHNAALEINDKTPEKPLQGQHQDEETRRGGDDTKQSGENASRTVIDSYVRYQEVYPGAYY